MVPWKLGLGLLVLLAIGALIVAADRKKRARRSTWPTCRGQILDAKLNPIRSIDARYATGPAKLLTLTYSYVVDGASYQGKATSDSRADRPSLLETYRPGAPVQISYDPAMPSISEINDFRVQQNTARLVLVLLTVGFIAMIWGILLGLFT